MGLKKVSDSEKNLVKKSLQKTSPRSRSRSCASTRPRSPSRSPVRSDSDDENSPTNPQGELSTGAGTKDERVFTQEEIQEMRNHKRYNTGFNGTETWKDEYDNDDYRYKYSTY